MDNGGEDIYRFDREHQGLAVVIVNFVNERKGADNDVNYMKKTFKRLGFKVECHTDVTKSKMEELLEECKYMYSVILRFDISRYSCSTTCVNNITMSWRDRCNSNVSR